MRIWTNPVCGQHQNCADYFAQPRAVTLAPNGDLIGVSNGTGGATEFFDGGAASASRAFYRLASAP